MMPRILPSRRRQRGFYLPWIGSGAGGGGDPYFSYVKSLIHWDGSNGASSFTESVGTTWSQQGGGSTLSTAEKVFGSASLNVSANGVRAGPSSAYTMASGDDFVIEFFYRPNSNTGFQIYVDFRPEFTSGLYTLIYSNSGTLVFDANGTRISGGTMTAGSWNYIAVARASGNTRMYLGLLGGGTASQVGSTYTSDTTAYNPTTTGIFAGKSAYANNVAEGYFDEFRYTVGHARGYSGSSISVPTAAFPDS